MSAAGVDYNWTGFAIISLCLPPNCCYRSGAQRCISTTKHIVVWNIVTEGIGLPTSGIDNVVSHFALQLRNSSFELKCAPIKHSRGGGGVWNICPRMAVCKRIDWEGRHAASYLHSPQSCCCVEFP